MTEDELADAVVDLAAIFQYRGAHFRPAKTAKGWRTPVSGALGKGWPDWVFVGPRGTLFRELKSATGKVSQEQMDVIEWLNECGNDAAVWRPEDLDSGRIEKEFRG